jgi:hypothetical protein
MGLFDKYNPHATRRTVIREAILWSAISFLFTLITFFYRSHSSPPVPFGIWGWVFMLMFMTVCGAVTGAAREWQVYDGLDDLEEDETNVQELNSRNQSHPS